MQRRSPFLQSTQKYSIAFRAERYALLDNCSLHITNRSLADMTKGETTFGWTFRLLTRPIPGRLQGWTCATM